MALSGTVTISTRLPAVRGCPTYWWHILPRVLVFYIRLYYPPGVVHISFSCLQGPSGSFVATAGGAPGLEEGVSKHSGHPQLWLAAPTAVSCLQHIGCSLTNSRILSLLRKRTCRISGKSMITSFSVRPCDL